MNRLLGGSVSKKSSRALTLIVGVPLIFLTLFAIYNESTYLNKLIVDLRRDNQGGANNTDSFVVSQESVPRHNLRLDVTIDAGIDKQKYKVKTVMAK